MKLVGFATSKVYVANSTCALHPFRHWNSSNTKFMPMTSLHFIIIILLAVKADAYPAIGDIASAGYVLFIQCDKMAVEFLVKFHRLGSSSSWFCPGLVGLSCSMHQLLLLLPLLQQQKQQASSGGRRHPPPRFLLVLVH